jgi:drug/metabolite transporter (DMT)-like permease
VSTARSATIALVIATALWGSGFTWAKTAGETVNHLAGVGNGAPLGPIWVLAGRFFIAAVLWLALFRDARRGWDLQVVWRSIVLGVLLSIGMIVQHLGLDRTSEAVSAFLTSLTILFVPLMMMIVLRRPPAGVMWAGVVVAGLGVWLLTGASASTFGLGELLGLACAVSYSVDIIAVNALVRPGDAARVTAGQFLVVGIIAAITCLFLPAGGSSLAPARVVDLMSHRAIGLNVTLLAVLASCGAFGLQFRFQPALDPTRAALLYLLEPIFACIVAGFLTGRWLDTKGTIGAVMILLANVLVELLQARRRSAGDADATITDAGAGAGPAIVD